jgi:Molybdopterin converting factor, small subunit
MISLRLVYLARLREAFASPGETLTMAVDRPMVEDVLNELRARGEPWSCELAEGRAVRIAVNHDMASEKTALQDNDELAFFPPVTGG